MKQHISYIRKWVASAMKIQQWEFILLLIQMDIGWKLYRGGNRLAIKFRKKKVKEKSV